MCEARGIIRTAGTARVYVLRFIPAVYHRAPQDASTLSSAQVNPRCSRPHFPALLFSPAEFYYTLWYDTVCGHRGEQRGDGRL